MEQVGRPCHQQGRLLDQSAQCPPNGVSAALCRAARWHRRSPRLARKGCIGSGVRHAARFDKTSPRKNDNKWMCSEQCSHPWAHWPGRGWARVERGAFAHSSGQSTPLGRTGQRGPHSLRRNPLRRNQRRRGVTKRRRARRQEEMCKENAKRQGGARGTERDVAAVWKRLRHH